MVYYIDKFSSKERYAQFIRYMLSISDAFSVVYFRYSESEPLKKSTREIKKLLDPYKIYSRNTTEWPGTKTWNQGGHVYRLAFYKADPRAEEALLKANDIFDWCYPQFPMDLSFYKEGYAFFASCAHERLSWFFSDSDEEVNTLKELGTDITVQREGEKPFFDEMLAKKMG